MKTTSFTHLNISGTNATVSALQQLLADFQIFYSNLRGLHWNIKGHQFFTLHEKFEELYDDTAEKADEIAERILMLDGVPENRYSEYLKKASIKEAGIISDAESAINNILESYSSIIRQERKIMEMASAAGDDVTASMMGDYLKEQEKLVWMICAYSSK